MAAGQESWDSAKDYVSDVFIGPRKEPLERAIAIDYVRHGLELTRKPESELAAAFNTELSRAVRHVERRSDAARDIIYMHKRHGENVSRVLEKQFRANAAGIVGGTLDPTSLLGMVAKRQHLLVDSEHPVEPTNDGSVRSEITRPGSDQASVAAILMSLENLHAKIDARPDRQPTKKAKAKPARRELIIFAAILLELRSIQYCSFLGKHGVKPRWSEPCPATYYDGYQKGDPWRKKTQDEKCRARVRMKGYTNSVLADAFNYHLPDRFEELSSLLNSRNSRLASETSAFRKPRKH